MEGVVATQLVAVDNPVRGGHDQDPVRGQHPLDLGDQLIVLGDVLESLETGHEVERTVGQIVQVADVALAEGDVRRAVIRAGVLDSGIVDVDTDYFVGLSSEDGGAIALARGEVQHAPTRCKSGSEQVPVIVLVDHR